MESNEQSECPLPKSLKELIEAIERLHGSTDADSLAAELNRVKEQGRDPRSRRVITANAIHKRFDRGMEITDTHSRDEFVFYCMQVGWMNLPERRTVEEREAEREVDREAERERERERAKKTDIC